MPGGRYLRKWAARDRKPPCGQRVPVVASHGGFRFAGREARSGLFGIPVQPKNARRRAGVALRAEGVFVFQFNLLYNSGGHTGKRVVESVGAVDQFQARRRQVGTIRFEVILECESCCRRAADRHSGCADSDNTLPYEGSLRLTFAQTPDPDRPMPGSRQTYGPIMPSKYIRNKNSHSRTGMQFLAG